MATSLVQLCTEGHFAPIQILRSMEGPLHIQHKAQTPVLIPIHLQLKGDEVSARCFSSKHVPVY
eukprot:12628338-Ditylum_brightwellii.AAC.1